MNKEELHKLNGEIRDLQTKILNRKLFVNELRKDLEVAISVKCDELADEYAKDKSLKHLSTIDKRRVEAFKTVDVLSRQDNDIQKAEKEVKLQSIDVEFKKRQLNIELSEVQ